jgi:hypothetical protein
MLKNSEEYKDFINPRLKIDHNMPLSSQMSISAPRR